MGENKHSQTHTDGSVYTHPRSEEYGDKFEAIFGERCVKCKKEYCKCLKELPSTQEKT